MMQSIAWSFSSIALMYDSLGSVRMRLIFSSSPLFFGTIKFTPVFCYDYSRIALKDLTYITIYDLLQGNISYFLRRYLRFRNIIASLYSCTNRLRTEDLSLCYRVLVKCIHLSYQ